MKYFAGKYDVIVIGAGHAGIEAALASARLGVSTAVFTVNLDWVGNMPCNPSIGGTSKGHLVREIDALGGEMGKAADRYSLQSRMLNLGKGPAVHSLRAQIDRREYSAGMKHVLEKCENLERVIIPDIAAWCNITFANDYANPLCGGHYIYTFAEEYDGDEVTAICPYCDVDSILAESSGFPLKEEFLKEMQIRYFGGEA